MVKRYLRLFLSFLPLLQPSTVSNKKEQQSQILQQQQQPNQIFLDPF